MKCFRGTSMRDCLAKIKERCGKDAIIVSHKRSADGVFEVTVDDGSVLVAESKASVPEEVQGFTQHAASTLREELYQMVLLAAHEKLPPEIQLLEQRACRLGLDLAALKKQFHWDWSDGKLEKALADIYTIINPNAFSFEKSDNNKSLTLIEGGYGAGKTQAIVALVHNLVCKELNNDIAVASFQPEKLYAADELNSYLQFYDITVCDMQSIEHLHRFLEAQAEHNKPIIIELGKEAMQQLSEHTLKRYGREIKALIVHSILHNPTHCMSHADFSKKQLIINTHQCGNTVATGQIVSLMAKYGAETAMLMHGEGSPYVLQTLNNHSLLEALQHDLEKELLTVQRPLSTACNMTN